MNVLTCPICGAYAEREPPTGDAARIRCRHCGSYRISGTAVQLLSLGTLKKPDPQTFAELVARKRSADDDYPLITSGDLGG
jgi:hypothetical protein